MEGAFQQAAIPPSVRIFHHGLVSQFCKHSSHYQVVSNLQRVVHCSNLAPGISHTDIAAALQAFGRPLFAMLLPNRSQYLIEMSSVEEASNIVHASAASPVYVLGRPIRTQFSRSQEITRATAIPLDPHAAALVTNARPAPPAGASGRVLLISIQNAIHPITVDVLEKILRPYGELLRVVVFEKERGVQALAEFRYAQEAEGALVALQGREIYDRCCRLSIIVSKNDTVNVRENSDTQRDFTNPSLPTRSSGSVPGSSISTPFASGAPGFPGYGAAPYGMAFPGGGLPYHHADRFDAPGHRQAFAGPAGRGPYDNGPRDAYDSRSAAPSAVFMVYNLPTPDVWPGFCHEHVFNLFSCFGDVLRVRLLSKPGSGMIEFANPRMASLAAEAVQRAPLKGKAMNITPSKHYTLVPNAPAGSAAATGMAAEVKDFSESPHHRFRKGPPAKLPNPPCSTVYFTNAPSTASEDKILALFTSSGTAVPSTVRFLPGTSDRDGPAGQAPRKAGFVDFPAVEEAVEAIMLCNNIPLDGVFLRLSFASRPTRPRREGVETAASGESSAAASPTPADDNATVAVGAVEDPTQTTAVPAAVPELAENSGQAQ